jgi:hypothetical protein
MPQNRDASPLAKLLENPRVWRGQDRARVVEGLSSGYEQLDRLLPGVAGRSAH